MIIIIWIEYGWPEIIIIIWIEVDLIQNVRCCQFKNKYSCFNAKNIIGCDDNRVDRNKYQIHIPLPPKIDPSVTMMQVEEKPDVTYSDVGGCKEQIEKLREVVETPLLHVSYTPTKK